MVGVPVGVRAGVPLVYGTVEYPVYFNRCVEATIGQYRFRVRIRGDLVNISVFKNSRRSWGNVTTATAAVCLISSTRIHTVCVSLLLISISISMRYPSTAVPRRYTTPVSYHPYEVAPVVYWSASEIYLRSKVRVSSPSMLWGSMNFNNIDS